VKSSRHLNPCFHSCHLFAIVPGRHGSEVTTSLLVQINGASLTAHELDHEEFFGYVHICTGASSNDALEIFADKQINDVIQRFDYLTAPPETLALVMVAFLDQSVTSRSNG